MIGLKYCGGCQSSYDRQALVANLKIDFNLEYAKETTIYDMILVVCGCANRCADISKLQTNNFVYLYSSNQTAAIRKELKEL